MVRRRLPILNKEEKVSLRKRWEAAKLAFWWTYRASPKLAIISLVLSMVGGLFPIVSPYVFKLIIDSLTSPGRMSLATTFGIGIGGMMIIYAVISIVEGIFFEILSMVKRSHGYRIEKYSWEILADKISHLDLVYFENPKYYDKLDKVNSAANRLDAIFWGITFFARTLVSAVIVAIVIIKFDLVIFIIILLSAIPGIIFSIKGVNILWGAFDLYSPVQRQARYYRNLLVGERQAAKEITLFGLKDYFFGKFKGLFDDFVKAQNKAMVYNLLWYSAIGIVGGGLSILAAWQVVKVFMGGMITIGSLTFMWSMVFQFSQHVRYTVGGISDLYSDATFITPVVDIMAFKPTLTNVESPKPFPKKIKQGIEFKKVTFYYPEQKTPSLKNLNLFIKPEENIALVGENGSGKTTLIKLLARLYDPTSGEILVDGVRLQDYSKESLYNNLGVIFQDFMKYEATAAENIGFGKLQQIAKKKLIRIAAKKSGADEFIKNLKDKYKTKLGRYLEEKGTDLSIGQWQKMALARAFFRDAEILILDEPTAAVDARTEYSLFRKFQRLTRHKTTVLISHRFSTVRMADRIIVMNKGRIVEQGSHKQLLRKRGRYAKLFSLQAEGYK